MPSMQAKRDVLYDEIETVLERHRADVQGHKHFRGLDQLKASRKARLEIMGDPTNTIWYFHVFPLGQDVLQQGADGTATRVAHDFNVQVIYEWKDEDTYPGSSQERWEEMMHNVDAPKGLVENLNDRAYIQAGGETTTIEPPVPMGEDMFDVTNLDGEGREWGHIAEMRITMLDPRA